MSKTNVRHKKFVTGILEGKTLISAYREAGYAPKTDATGYTLASRLFRNDQIQAAIKEEMDKQEAIDRLRLDRIRSEAIIEQHKLVKSATNDDRVKLDAIKDVLDRTGLKVAEKLEHSGSVDHKVKVEFVGIPDGYFSNRGDREDDQDSS